MDLSFLPAVEAAINVGVATLLVRGRLQIRHGDIERHRRTMLTAAALTATFLILYVTHKVSCGFRSTTLNMDGPVLLAYRTFLVSHLVLAMTVPFLIVRVIRLASDPPRHKKWARWVWPIWLYVSVTGVLIYVILYHLNPAAV